MGQPFVKNHLHIVFSTKYRQPQYDALSGLKKTKTALKGHYIPAMGCSPSQTIEPYRTKYIKHKPINHGTAICKKPPAYCV